MKAALSTLFLILLLLSCSKDEPVMEEEIIVYSFSDDQATVKRINFQIVSDILEIPASVMHDNKEYKVTEILNNAFHRVDISTLILPITIEKIGYSVFYSQKITELYIPDLLSWMQIDFEEYFEATGNTHFFYSYANPIRPYTRFFIDGIELKNTLTIPEEISVIKPRTFQYLNIEKLILGENVTEIGKQAFSNCENLNIIEFKKNLKKIGNQAFECCTSLLELNLPEGVEYIETGAFNNCSNLVTLTLPSTLLFFDCNLEGCDSLSSISLYCEKPPLISEYSFGPPTEVAQRVTIYVPENSVSLYETAPFWRLFENIRPIEGKR